MVIPLYFIISVISTRKLRSNFLLTITRYKYKEIAKQFLYFLYVQYKRKYKSARTREGKLAKELKKEKKAKSDIFC